MPLLERISAERIVEAASLAPSAENNQPWQFRLRDGQITVYLDTRRGLGSDVDHMFDLTAIGAAIENACIAARQEGLELQVDILESGPLDESADGLLPVATAAARSGGGPDVLYDVLHKRCTCRTLDPRRAVPADQLEQLTHAAEVFGGVRVHWITERERIGELAQIVAWGDRIRFEFPPFQNEFFRNIRFTAREVEATRDGLDVRTLELPRGGSLVLALLRNGWLLRAGNRVGLSRLLVKPSKQWIRRSPAVGILVVDAADKERFVVGGRGLERLWLTATSLGLGIHPVGSLPIFMAYAERTSGARLAPRHSLTAREIARRTRHLVPEVRDDVVQLAFRVGIPQRPNCRSLRLPLDRILRVTAVD